MKLNKAYTSINVCPETGDTINNVCANDGVCPHCGHHNNSGIMHYNKVSGRWNIPTLWERIYHRRSSEFVSKKSEDDIIKSLSSNRSF